MRNSKREWTIKIGWIQFNNYFSNLNIVSYGNLIAVYRVNLIIIHHLVMILAVTIFLEKK